MFESSTIVMIVTMIVMMMMALSQIQGADALSAGPVTATAIVSTDIAPLVDVPVWSMATLNDDDDDYEDENKTRTTTAIRTRTTNMNLITYATPVSIRPNRLYALGLYKQTKSRDNFLREKTCVLQLLSDTKEHISCVKLLGGTSGKDVNKEDALSSIHGIELQDLVLSGDDDDDDNNNGGGGGQQEVLPKVLPGCVRYLKLSLVGEEDIVDYDGGESSHDVVICKVDKMWTSSSTSTSTSMTEKDENENENENEVEKQGKEKNNNNNNDYLSTGRLRELGLITEQGRIASTSDE